MVPTYFRGCIQVGPGFAGTISFLEPAPVEGVVLGWDRCASYVTL